MYAEGNVIASKVLKVGKDFDSISWTENAYIAADGTITTNQPGFRYSDLITLPAGDYAIYARKKSASDAAKTLRIHAYNSSGVWQRQITYASISEPPSYCYEVQFTVAIGDNIRISTHQMTDLVSLVPYNSYGKTLVYRGQLTSGDDVHNLTLPGMYYVSGTSVPQNFPISQFISARLLVIKSSSNSHSGEFHIFIGSNYMFIENYGDNNQWSGWRKIMSLNSGDDNTYLKYRGQLTSEDDMNEIDYPGMYYVNLDDPPAHFPSEEMEVNTGRFRVLVNKSAESGNHYGELQLISGEKNLYFRTGSSGGNLKPWNIVYGHRSQRHNEIQSEAIMLGLHVVPENRGVLNAIKRARQQTDIKWTPCDDIPRGFLETGDTYSSSHFEYLGIYKKGIEYTGLPYSEAHYLANEYSIDAFVTSAANPRSVMILESAGTPSNYACYYGTVCTNLTSYALNIPTVNSNNWTKIDGISTVGLLSNVTPKNLDLCDILQIDGHCAIITDIISDENDNVILIEVSEATRQGNIPPLSGFFVERFFSKIDSFTIR